MMQNLHKNTKKKLTIGPKYLSNHAKIMHDVLNRRERLI